MERYFNRIDSRLHKERSAEKEVERVEHQEDYEDKKRRARAQITGERVVRGLMWSLSYKHILSYNNQKSLHFMIGLCCIIRLKILLLQWKLTRKYFMLFLRQNVFIGLTTVLTGSTLEVCVHVHLAVCSTSLSLTHTHTHTIYNSRQGREKCPSRSKLLSS